MKYENRSEKKTRHPLGDVDLGRHCRVFRNGSIRVSVDGRLVALTVENFCP
jgi:hypothetical protein